jgi:N4-gp56 family major capsid protein
MAIDAFIPEIWSARLLRHLDKRLVYAQPTVVNRDYEGEISGGGDVVHIQKVADVTVKSYSKNTDMAVPDRADGSTVPLTIDESWYWNIAIDDVNKVQANVAVLDRFAERAGFAMASKIDSAVAAVMVANAGIDLGTSGAPKTVQATGGDYTLYTLAVELRRLLDNNNAPNDGRWIVIPPDLEKAALLDPLFVSAASETGAGTQRTGSIGTIAGFDVLKTTAVPTITKTGGATYDSWGVLFGAGNYGTTHANQVVETEAYRIERQFGDAVKGLNVWGTDVVEADTVGCAVVSKGA